MMRERTNQAVLKEGYKLLLINFAVGIAAFGTLIFNDLTNSFDGLWHETLYHAFSWQISIGRWFWYIFDKLRFGYAANAANSYVSIMLIALGNTLLADLFGQVGKRSTWLHCSLFMVSTTVSCFLSYRFMSPVFAAGYLLSVASVWILDRNTNRWIGGVIASILLCLSMGLYQAFLGCAMVLILLRTVEKLIREERSMSAGIAWLIRGVGVVVVAFALYVFVWVVFRKGLHVLPRELQGRGFIVICDCDEDASRQYRQGL